MSKRGELEESAAMTIEECRADYAAQRARDSTLFGVTGRVKFGEERLRVKKRAEAASVPP